MSHTRLRKEKDCLNCGAMVEGRYCAVCGQENVEPKQGLWHLLTHFFNDITHFDGKFFTTVKPLILRPGFLSSEYIKGRRVKYLDPVRMYFFVSAVFAIAFIAFNQDEIIIKDEPGYKQKVDSIRNSLTGDKFNMVFDSLKSGTEITVFQTPLSWRQTIEHYDSLQKTAPDSLKDGFIKRYLMKRAIQTTEAYNMNPYHVEPRVINNFYHSFSKIFFFSLPIFAFILYLVYIRRRKQFYFVSHAIFSIHYYCVILIFWVVLYMMLESIIPVKFEDKSAHTLSILIPLALIVYLYVAMLRFYKQGWFKTLIKFFILGSLTTIVILFLVGGIFFKSMLDLAAH